MKTYIILGLKVILFLFLFVVSVGFAQVIYGFAAGYNFEQFANKDFQLPSKNFMFMQFFSTIAAVAFVLILLRIEKIKFSDLGWSFNFNHQLQALILGGIFIFLFFILLNLLHQIKFVNDFKFNYLDFIFLSLGLLFAAFIEEITLRGYLMKMLGKKLNLFWSLFISSAVFALLHLENPNLGIIPWINLFLAGIVLGYIYYKTKNIWFVTLLHFSWNLTQTFLGFNVSGQDFASYFQFRELHENAFTGGLFGFEGSVFSIVSLVILLFIFLPVKAKRPKEI